MLVPAIIEPNPGAKLRHQYHLRDHDSKIYYQKDIELVSQGADLEFVLALIQHLLCILSSVYHQSINITGVLEKSTPWNELLQI